MIVFDGYGFGRNGQRVRITHPFLVIDGNVYTKSGGTLVRWTLNEFEQQVRAKIDSSNTYQVGGTEGTLPLTDHEKPWPEIPLDGHPNFPGLDPDALKASLDAMVGHTSDDRSCIQTLDDVGESSGLDLLPESLEETVIDPTDPRQYQQADEFLRKLNIDPFTVPTGDGRNPEGRPFQKHEGFLADWLRSLPAAIQKIIQVIFAFDPNDKVGSQGVDNAQYISGEEPLRYSVFFENLETATAPAQEVVITDQLDPVNMDLATLSLGPLAFGNTIVTPPTGLRQFTTDVLIPGQVLQNLIVRVTASLNLATGLLTWRFTSIDPATGDLPANPLEGFLPPNINPPEGDGSVLFTVIPKQGLPTGTEIRNHAEIIFDVNEPIVTPEWLNTLDNTKPTSQVASLSATQTSASFEVRWAGDDVGSGIKGYTIFVSENDSPFAVWLSNIPDTSGTFSGENGKTYAFYSVARDRTGNLEDTPSRADTTTQVDAGITVAVDIKPGSFPNSINPRSKGVIPVAIVTTDTFDATTVDPLSVAFGPNGATEAHRRGHLEDADGDGDLDLVLHFRTQETGIQCGDTSTSLTGQTFDEQQIEGSDSITTVGCPH